MSSSDYKKSINLKESIRPPKRIWDRIIESTNVITAGGSLVVCIIVLVLLVFRFYLLFNLISVKTEVNSLNRQLVSLKDTETLVTNFENDVTKHSSLWQSSAGFSSVLDKITPLIPTNNPTVIVTIDQNKVVITGKSPLSTAADLERSILKSDFLFDPLRSIASEPDKASSKGNPVYSFTISARFMKVGEDSPLLRSSIINYPK